MGIFQVWAELFSGSCQVIPFFVDLECLHSFEGPVTCNPSFRTLPHGCVVVAETRAGITIASQLKLGTESLALSPDVHL